MKYGAVAVVAFFILGAAVVPIAKADEAQFDFNIPAQPLTTALRSFAHITHAQVVYDEASLRGQSSVAVNGRMTVERALNLIMSKSGMAERHDASGVYVIGPSSQSAEAPAAPMPAKSDGGAQDPAKPANPTTVVVTGKTPTVVHRVDRTIYNLKDNPQAENGNLGDFLNTLPSVVVNPNGAVTVRGGSVEILIDGKPSTALKGGQSLIVALQSIPANTIDRIEVITNPGAEFRTDQAAIINIVTKKSRAYKTEDEFVVNGGPDGRYNSTLSGSVTVGKWTLNGVFATLRDWHNSTSHTDRLIFASLSGPIASQMIEDQNHIVHVKATSLDDGLTYAAENGDTFNLTDHLSGASTRQWHTDSVAFIDNSGVPFNETLTDASGTFHLDMEVLTGTWKHRGKRDGEIFTLAYRHEEHESLQDLLFTENQDLPTPSAQLFRRSNADRDLTDEVSGDYILPMGGDKLLKAGFDWESDRRQFNNVGTDIDTTTGNSTPDPIFTNRFMSDQTLSALYGAYQLPMGKWIVEGGLRLENLTTDLGQLAGEPNLVRSDLEWSPSFFASRDLGARSKVKFTYSRRVDRPDAGQLNPSPQRVDTQDIVVGNPSLRPALIDSFEAGYTYGSKTVTFDGTFYSRYTRNLITAYSYYSDPTSTILTNSWENSGNASRDGLDLSLGLQPSSKIGYSLSSDVYYEAQTTTLEGPRVQQSLVSQVSKATATLTPTAGDKFQATVILNGSNLIAGGRTSSAAVLNMTYSHTLAPRLKIVVSANDAFKSARFSTTLLRPQYREYDRSAPKGQAVFVGLDYKFGNATPR